MDYLCRSLCVAIACLVGLAGAVPCSYAGETLYKTGFEPPTFVPGPLVGQDGWTAPPPISPLSSNAAVISTDKPHQGQQSVLVPGTDLVPSADQGQAPGESINELTNGYYDAIGSYRKPVCVDLAKPGCTSVGDFTGYDTRGTQTVRVSAHVRVDGRRTGPKNNFFSASLGAVALGFDNGEDTPEGVGELAISSDGQVHAYSGADLVPTFLTSAHVTLGEWHNLAVEANCATRETSFFVDDECLGSFPFDPRVTTDLLLRGSMLTYAAPDTATTHKADYAAHFDQFSIKVVEPEECEVKGADR